MDATAANKTGLHGTITDTGLSVVYVPPKPKKALVNIVFVHGLQGHPFKTWASNRPPKRPHSPSSSRAPKRPRSPSPSPGENIEERDLSAAATDLTAMQGKGPKKSWLKKLVSRLSQGSKNDEVMATPRQSGPSHQSRGEESTQESGPDTWFWPRDWVPQLCPEARVLTWGYDSHVTKLFGGASCNNTIYSHAKDLLFSLERVRSPDYGLPIIFVVHSLGGIIVKEMLSVSAQSLSWNLTAIVESTTAVTFLGTPHRGSLDLARLGNMGRSVVSALGFDSTSAALDALRLRTSDLERCQESFSRLWNMHGFHVKTFQESLGLSGVNIGPLNDLVVPSFSSLLGDARENAETLHANHKDMCRFYGPDDPNQTRVVRELHRHYLAVKSRLSLYSEPDLPSQAQPHNILGRSSPSGGCSDILESLNFSGIEQGRGSVPRPAQGTGEWIFEDEAFLDWHQRRKAGQHKGLLWIQGNPASGKSTLMQEMRRRVPLHGHNRRNVHVAAFFFDAKAQEQLLHRAVGFYRSIIFQLLLPRSANAREQAIGGTDRVGDRQWLKELLENIILEPSSPPTILLVDALDECDQDDAWDVFFFLDRLAGLAHAGSVELDICLSSRPFGAPRSLRCPTVVMEKNNATDIAIYVDQRLSAFLQPAQQLESLAKKVLDMSHGIFLWAVLAVDSLVRGIDAGLNVKYLENQLTHLPEGLHELFRDILLRDTKDRDMRLRFFQWVVCGGELQLREWRCILPFLSRPVPRSLAESRQSMYYAKDDEQLEKLIRHISMGLVQVAEKNDATSSGEANDGSVSGSIAGAAGSLNWQEGDTRLVEVIHESVREFFISGDGFAILSRSESPARSLPEDDVKVGRSHAAIMETCLDLIEVPELDPIIAARRFALLPQNVRLPASELSQPGSARLDHSAQSARSDHSAQCSVGSYQSAASSRHGSRRSSPSPPTNPLRILWEPEPQRERPEDPADEESMAALTESDAVLRSNRLADFFQSAAAAEPASSILSKLPSRAPTINSTSSSQATSGPTAPLLDYPDCLPYILGTFAHHARRARHSDGKLDFIFRRLKAKEGHLWQRWVALDEQLDPESSVGMWARDQGLYQEFVNATFATF